MQKGVEVTVHDLSKNPLSDQEIVKVMTKAPGQMRAPVIEIDDKVVLGYNRERLDELT